MQDDKYAVHWWCYEVALLDFLNIVLFREHNILKNNTEHHLFPKEHK